MSDRLQIFVGTLGTRGQHEFAFGFRGCTRSLSAGIRAIRTLLFEHSCLIARPPGLDLGPDRMAYVLPSGDILFFIGVRIYP